MAAASARSFATACVLAVLLAGCLLAASADARRLLYNDGTAMPPAPMAAYAVDYDDGMSPALAPAPESGADDDDGLAGRMLFRGRGLLDDGLQLAGRLLLGIGL